MFSLRRTDSSDLLTSLLYDEVSFYKVFVKDLNKATKSIIIESPYLTERRAIQFSLLFRRLHQTKGIKITVLTRNPRHHDRGLEIQSWKAMYVLRDHGVKVKTYDDLRHRKLAIVDNEVLYEGSLNILSQSNSKEIMRRSNSKLLCRQMTQFIGIRKIHC
jgi:phosphatidylserine/phosphatidylglycerophosphate/cardiolipin synthase-like enzyme